MYRSLVVALGLLVSPATVAFADPGIVVIYENEVLRVQLDGWYGGSYYTIWRSDEYAGVYYGVTAQGVSCTGNCFVNDLRAVPGRTYYYRFDLAFPDGSRASYGPYPVTVPDTPFGVRVSPNPGRGSTRVEFSLPGSRSEPALEVEARLVDLQGRSVRVLHRGPLARGTTTIEWDGRSAGGRYLGAGLYFLRVTSPLGSSTTRIVRIG